MNSAEIAIERSPGRDRIGPARVGASLFIALTEFALCLSIFGPQPLAWLWVGSQVDYATDSLSAGLATAFVGSVTTIVLSVWAGKRLERLFLTLRPDVAAKGRVGLFEVTFVVSTVIAVIGFVFWFFVIAGPGPTIAPNL